MGKNEKSISEWLTDLSYKNSKKQLRNTLLTFNIATLLNKHSIEHTKITRDKDQETRYLWFPFSEYKVGSWDIEHIHSVHSRKPLRKEDIVEWLQLHNTEMSQIIPKDILEQMQNLHGKLVQKDQALTQDLTQDFESLYLALIKEFSGNKDGGDLDINTIGNLTLLRPEINRSYGNALFPLKRKTRQLHGS